MAAGMRTQAHPDAAEELAGLVVEASGRATREQYRAEAAAAATPVDREASGWFESTAPGGGPTLQRRVDRRSKRMEAYPPIDRTTRAAAQAPVVGQGPDAGDSHRNGQDAPPAPNPPPQGGPPTDQDAGS
jgi:hypothetical protein